MEVPAPEAGVVKEIKVKLGDKVSEGSLIVVIEPRPPQPTVKPRHPRPQRRRRPPPNPLSR